MQDTRSELLSEAENLVRTKGFASFSYADLAERVGIRKASIHHHFPTKEALGIALIDSYLEKFQSDLATLAARKLEQRSKLLAYGDFFAVGLRQGLMPLCGALAANSAELPRTMQERVKFFFELHLNWLDDVIREGIAKGEFRQDLQPKKSAALVLSVLEGASLSAWAMNNPSMIKAVLLQVLETLES